MFSRIVAGVLALAGVGLFVQALGEARERGVELGGPTLAPLIVTGLWVVLSLAYLWHKTPAPEGRWVTPALLLGSLVAYAFTLKYTVVGYVLATAAFFFGAARLLQQDRQGLIRDGSVAIGLSLTIYLVFTRLLGISLPAGVLPL